MKQGKKKIRAMKNGVEILAKTTDSWFLNRMDTILGGKVPLRADYYAMDKVLRRFQKLKSAHGEKAVAILWMLLWNTIDGFELKGIASAFPREMKDIAEVLEKGGTAKYQLPDRVRSQEWLEQNGNCLVGLCCNHLLLERIC